MMPIRSGGCRRARRHAVQTMMDGFIYAPRNRIERGTTASRIPVSRGDPLAKADTSSPTYRATHTRARVARPLRHAVYSRTWRVTILFWADSKASVCLP